MPIKNLWFNQIFYDKQRQQQFTTVSSSYPALKYKK